ncbi:MAG: hypothetical protein IT342_01575, partial [Candidatus Melainabacteria bacterium]|nr:hypothetical protein [Candidatus Melainabacteria bacterium]
RWMERLGAQVRAEFVDEMKDEAYEKGAEIGIEHFAGKTNPAMSVFASALIASRKGLSGIDLHPQAGGSIEMNFGPGVNQAEMMSIFRDQMLTDGLQVDWNGQADSPMTVKTPEGYSVDVKLKGAAQQAGSEQAAPAQTDLTQRDGVDGLAKLSRGGADGPAFEADHKAALLGKLETELELEGANLSAEERTARLAEIEGLKADILSNFKNEAATQLSRATGISQQDAAAIVDGLKIQLQPYSASTTRAGKFKNADGSLTMQVGGDMPQAVSPHKTFVHEFTHALDAAKYSALYAANPTAFVDALVADVTSNSFTGKTGIWNKPGARNASDMLYTRQRAGENGLTEADVSFARDMLGNYMRQNAADGKLPETPSATALADWIKANGGQFPNSKNEAALLSEMVREISHANMVFAESQLGADAMKNPAMQKMVQAFAASQSADPVVIRHMMRGVSDATTAMADGTHYDFGSRYENRANRLQARATIEASQNAMPALTSELLAATKGKPEFAALNAKLETLMGRKDESARRAGVRQSEYFASEEGQAQLAKLKADSSMAGIIAEKISGNVRARQDALSTQRFLTALDMLPARKAQLDAADGDGRMRAQKDYLNTIQSLYANGKASDLPNLTRFLNSSGLASGDQVLSALTADSGALLASRDNATISKVVQSLEASGLSRTRILEVLADASTGSPALSIRLAEISSALPPAVDVQIGSRTLAQGWKSTLDSLSKVDVISRFNRASTQSAITSDIEATVSDWTPAREKFDNLRMLQDRAEHAAKQEAAWKALGPDAKDQTAHWAKLKTDFGKSAADITAELAPEISRRADALQTSLNRTLAASNLPAAKITVANMGSSTSNGANTAPARYNPATGNIEVSADVLLTASPSEISNLVRAEYEKSLAHQTARAAAGNESLSQTERDAAARVNEMFAVQTAADAKVEQLSKQLETLEDNRRLLLSEGGIQTLMGRMSAKDANIDSILGVAPPPELNGLLAKYQQARKPDGTVDTKKWTLESDQEVSRLLFPSVYKAGMQTRSDLQNARADRPPSAGESAYDRAGIDNSFVDAIASTPFSPDFSAQMDQRIGLAMDHSWAMPDRASLSAIYDFAGENGVVEVGAGKGVWAGALRKMGLSVSAYDINANNVQDNPYHRGESVSTVEQGGVEKAGEHPNKTLLLSWPTPGEPMGADALKAYTEAGGTRLAFIGERPTPGGDNFNTGDKQFHEALNKDWVLKEVVEMPHVPDGMSLSTSKLYLYERRGTTSPELVKASKLPETPSTTEILDRASANDQLPPKQRATYEMAVQEGILKPEELAQIFSNIDSANRELVVHPLLSNGKLTETGASTLALLSNSQVNALSELSRARLDSFVSLMNNPQIPKEDIGALLSKPKAKRAAYENLLLGGTTPPSTEVSAKILKMSDVTAADLDLMIAQRPEQRQAVLDFVQGRGLGEISFAAHLSTRKDLSPMDAIAILNGTVRNADIASDPARKAAADRDLALVTETLRGLDTTASGKLMGDLATGMITPSEVARLQEAAQKGLIGNSDLPMSAVLAAPASRRNALLSMLESERLALPERRLGPQGLQRVFQQGTRITAAVERGVTSHGEIHSLMTGSLSDAVAAEIILKQGSSETGLPRRTVEGLIAAARDGSISVTGLESLRSAINQGVMSESGLSGLLAQPADARRQLSQQFEKLWSMRRSVHDTHLDRPIAERSAAVIESDNKKFIEQFAAELANHPGDSATAKMAADRLSGYHPPSLSELEPALVPRAEPMALNKPIGNAPPEVQAFAAAMAKGDLREAIRIGMVNKPGLSDNFTNVKIDYADLSNPEQIEAVIEKMDKIGFASGYEGRGESGSVADLARPVVTLPNGKVVDLSGPDIKLMDGVPTAQDQKFIEMLESDPAVRVLRGRVALTAYEERIIHSDQGRGGAKSLLVREEFTQSKEYAEMEKYYRDRDPARMQEAMREIDVAARLVESGMSLKDVRELMGSRHLGGEREFFYNWFAAAHPDRVVPAVEAQTTARPSWGIGQEIVLDGSDGKPVDPVLEQWVKNAKERLQLDQEEALALEQALESGEAKFVTLDRKALEALEVEQDIYSFEGGREVNSRPYESAGRRKIPLQHADKYDPATHVEAALIVKGKVDGRDRYFVVNGCRRIHVFGSEATNPGNKSIPVLLFENADAFTRAISHDPRSSFGKATPFSFEVE